MCKVFLWKQLQHPIFADIEVERKVIEKESLKPWPIGLKLFKDSSSLVDPKWSAAKEKKLIKSVTLSDENFHIDLEL